jgi:hypothetical protein
MSVLRTLSRTKAHVRCGSPDCDWGTLPPSFSEVDRYLREFREHCIQRHGLDPKDAERVALFNLEELTLTLLEWRALVGNSRSLPP